MFKQFKFKLFIKLFSFYICSIVLPFILISTILIQFVISTYKNNIFSYHENISKQISQSVNSDLNNMETTILYIRNNAVIPSISMSAEPTNSDTIYNLKKLQNDLTIHKAHQEAIGSIGVYFSSMGNIITESSNYTYEQYYNSLSFKDNISLTQFEEKLKSKKTETFVTSASDHSYEQLTIIRPIYTDYNGNKVAIVYSVQPKRVFDLFSGMSDDLSESFFALTQGNSFLSQSDSFPENVNLELIFSSPENKFFECGNGYVAIKTESFLPSSNYVYLVWEDAILSKVQFVETILTLAIILVLIILAVAAYLLSCKSFSPIAALVSNSNDQKGYYNLDSYNDISLLVTDTININNNLRSTIDRQRKCINDNLFITFLQNSMDMSKQTIDILFADINPQLNKPFFNVVLMNIENNSELSNDVAQLTAIENMRRILEENGILLALIPNETGKIVILANHNIEEDSLEQCMKKYSTFLGTKYKIDVSLSIGRRFDDLNMFSKSYEDALYHDSTSADGYLLDENSERELKNVFYTAEDKKNLINYVLNFDHGNVTAFFDNLTYVLFIENTLTYRILSLIRYSLSETLSEIVYKFHSNNDLDNILNDCRLALEGQNYLESYKTIARCFSKVTTILSRLENMTGEDLRTSIENYIKKNYAVPDISLNHIAKEFNFSYSYLSKFFKKEFGCTFVNYLHLIRIEASKNLLRDGSSPISEVAEKLGYLSSNTFIKTFKKYEGMSPGEFRKSNN